MKIQKIELDKSGKPKNVTIKMTATEALFIAHAIGETNYEHHQSILTDGGDIARSINTVLNRDLFRPFYEDGIFEAKKEHENRR